MADDKSMFQIVVRCCETCANNLGGGCCKINLEAECAKGEYEAWKPNSQDPAATPPDPTMTIIITQDQADYILAHKEDLAEYLADELVRRIFGLDWPEIMEGGQQP